MARYPDQQGYQQFSTAEQHPTASLSFMKFHCTDTKKTMN